MTVQHNFVKVVAVEDLSHGYIAYVFQYLNDDDIKRYGGEYVICTRYPNWMHRNLKVEDVGFVEIETVRAGIDTWFDGEKQVPYRYNAKRFIKFIDKPSSNTNDYHL